jgi:hypothetical protein
MILMNRNHFVIAILLCSVNFLFAQEEKSLENTLNKNAIYANAGTAGLYFTATAYYERILTQKRKIATFTKIGVGGYDTFEGDRGQYILAQYGLLTGAKKRHHLEVGAGPAYFIVENEDGEVLFNATVGWRIQKPGGNFIFRTGLSFPEALYLGLGFSF